jgi:large subunit ribosomal protein L3
MTQLFLPTGDRVPVTVVRAGPCTVVQKKTPETDGYSAVQLGFEAVKESRLGRPRKGHLDRAGVPPQRFLFEVRLPAEEVGALQVGQTIGCADAFRPGQKVDVTGTTKGRGFTGVVKRHGFPTRTSTHGTHEYFRHGGANASGTFPGRLFPGKRMSGHYGDERCTILRLEVMKVDAEQNLLFIRGAVPGAVNGLVRVRDAIR